MTFNKNDTPDEDNAFEKMTHSMRIMHAVKDSLEESNSFENLKRLMRECI